MTISISTIATIVSIAVGLVALIGFTVRVIKPLIAITAKIQEHDKKLVRDFACIEEAKKRDRTILQSQLAILNHLIDGNHVNKMKETRDSIIERLDVE